MRINSIPRVATYRIFDPNHETIGIWERFFAEVVPNSGAGAHEYWCVQHAAGIPKCEAVKRPKKLAKREVVETPEQLAAVPFWDQFGWDTWIILPVMQDALLRSWANI